MNVTILEETASSLGETPSCSQQAASCLSETLKVQPVMDAGGVICEMALVAGEEGGDANGFSRDASAMALRKAGAVFRASGCLVPLTLDHPLDVCSEMPLAEQLCLDLKIATVAKDLLPAASPHRGGNLSVYPSAMVVYNVPLSSRLVDGADLFRPYHEFRPALRIRLLPCNGEGAPAPFGLIRAVGIRVGIPAGIYQNHKLQDRFFSLLGQASRKGLRVLASDIKSIEDFNWLRLQPDVLFQGDVLSTALSLEYIQQWLTGLETDWRTFQMGA